MFLSTDLSHRSTSCPAAKDVLHVLIPMSVIPGVQSVLGLPDVRLTFVLGHVCLRKIVISPLILMDTGM